MGDGSGTDDIETKGDGGDALKPPADIVSMSDGMYGIETQGADSDSLQTLVDVGSGTDDVET